MRSQRGRLLEIPILIAVGLIAAAVFLPHYPVLVGSVVGLVAIVFLFLLARGLLEWIGVKRRVSRAVDSLFATEFAGGVALRAHEGYGPPAVVLDSRTERMACVLVNTTSEPPAVETRSFAFNELQLLVLRKEHCWTFGGGKSWDEFRVEFHFHQEVDFGFDRRRKIALDYRRLAPARCAFERAREILAGRVPSEDQIQSE